MTEEKKVYISECFYSLQGEGVYAGVPTVFLRLFGCNLNCAGFGQRNPTEPSLYVYEQAQDNIKSLKDFKPVVYGCDTPYSKDKCYLKFCKYLTVSETINEISKVIRENVDVSDGLFKTFNGNDIHLVITGGEPFLHQEFLTNLLIELNRLELKYITFETNGTLPIEDSLSAQLTQFETLLSISPKLYNCSGIPNEKAIKYDILTEYYFTANSCLKFVMSDKPLVWDEMESIVLRLKQMGCNFDVRIMPVGSTYEDYVSMSTKVAEICMLKGYKFSPRLHVNLWLNTTGT
jgi:organic radical activating enzyme